MLPGERQVHLRPGEVVGDAVPFDLQRRVVEVGEQPVVVLLRERVVLVVVALHTLHRGAEPDRAGRVDAVDHLVGAVLFRIDARLDVAGRQPVKAGGNLLIDSRAG